MGEAALSGEEAVFASVCDGELGAEVGVEGT